MSFLDAFDSLNRVLSDRNQKVVIIVCGGIVIELRYKGEPTIDVDTVEPLEESVKTAISTVGREHNLQPNWLNDAPVLFEFGKFMPDGWRDRALAEEPLYEGTGLTLYPLSKKDMVITKLAAAVDRSGFEGIKDVRAVTDCIGVTAQEIETWLPDIQKLVVGGGTQSLEKIKEILSILGVNFEE
jgi:hypothetical protein